MSTIYTLEGWKSMFLTGTMKINAQGHLVIGGIDTLELVK